MSMGSTGEHVPIYGKRQCRILQTLWSSGVNRLLVPQEKRSLDIVYCYYTECPYIGFQRWLKHSQRMSMGSVVTWPIAMVPQSYWYFGSNGDQLVQHIYRLDNLDDLKSDLLKRFDLHLDIGFEAFTCGFKLGFLVSCPPFFPCFKKRISVKILYGKS